MKIYYGFVLLLIFIAVGCNNSDKANDREKWKGEIKDVEKAFNDMAQKDGLVKAFEYFAADDGVIKRSNKVVKGKAEITKWYTNNVQPNENLSWSPTYIDVSSTGDLAYTYGDYIFSYPDSLGEIKENTGIFHTVWKRQSDGNWKFVWD